MLKFQNHYKICFLTEYIRDYSTEQVFVKSVKCEKLSPLIKGRWGLQQLASAESPSAHTSHSFSVSCSSPRAVTESVGRWACGLKEKQALLEVLVLGGICCSDETFRGFHSRAEIPLLIVGIPNGPVINQEQSYLCDFFPKPHLIKHVLVRRKIRRLCVVNG